MASGVVRTTIALPADLLAAADVIVREGKARNRNELLSIALRHELVARERAAIDAEFAEMANDLDYLAEAEAIQAEFATSDWEAFRAAENQSVMP